MPVAALVMLWADSVVEKIITSESVVYDGPLGRNGFLSCASPGFPLRVEGIEVASAELLLLACRFPSHAGLQKAIIEHPNAPPAIWMATCYRYARKDWSQVRVDIMRWVLRLRLIQHIERYAPLLIETRSQPIVEISAFDTFWGAIETKDPGMAWGNNRRGKLLVELRNDLAYSHGYLEALLPPVPNMRLLGQEIGVQIRDERSIDPG